MKSNMNDANVIWEAFLARCPLDKLDAIVLEQYTQVKGDRAERHLFACWLETRIKTLGLYGGIALDFLRRKQLIEKVFEIMYCRVIGEDGPNGWSAREFSWV